jgi:hypothetical protein
LKIYNISAINISSIYGKFHGLKIKKRIYFLKETFGWLKPVLGGSLIFKEPLVLVLQILSKSKNRLFGFFDLNIWRIMIFIPKPVI